jgi:hypothetical protein
MERSRLSAAVYKRTGTVISPDDPAFAIVELNRLVVVEEMGQLLEQLEALLDKIDSGARDIAAKVASQGVGHVAEREREARKTIATDTQEAQRRLSVEIEKVGAAVARQVAAAIRAAQPSPRAGTVHRRWLLACAAAGLVSFTAGFAVGELVATDYFFGRSAGR